MIDRQPKIADTKMLGNTCRVLIFLRPIPKRTNIREHTYELIITVYMKQMFVYET